MVALLYLMGWLPTGDSGWVERWVRKNAIALFVAGILLIVTRNPLLAVLGGMAVYPLTQKKDWIPGRRPAASMSIEEAYHLLGLSPGATADDIKNAHRNLIMRNHPDQGGTAYLAAKINEAKEILLKNVIG
jgi:hypothetical protein